jgi:hypothetical protein
MVQYELKSGEVEIRTIEISSPTCGIHRGSLDNVMRDHIAKLLPQKLSKSIFKKFENFREMFSFFGFRKNENCQKMKKNRKSENFQIFEIWKMKIFPEIFQNF